MVSMDIWEGQSPKGVLLHFVLLSHLDVLPCFGAPLHFDVLVKHTVLVPLCVVLVTLDKLALVIQEDAPGHLAP